jgi:photosystem II stability/assembly factor-like uncharacterized protein
MQEVPMRHVTLRGKASRTLAATAITIVIAVAPVAPVNAGASPDGGEPSFSWQLLESTSDLDLFGLDAISAEVAWVGSTGPEILRTVDGGVTFTDVAPAEAGGDWIFADVEAFSADRALVTANIPGEAPRMYRTANGGSSWTETYRADSPAQFLACIAMFDHRHGFVSADPVDGKFEIIVTANGGRSWERSPDAGMPDALDGELSAIGGGECATATGRNGFFGTAFGAEARVFRSADMGLTWEVSSTPIEQLISALDFRTNRLGLASGAHATSPEYVTALARTTDGGVTWELVKGWDPDHFLSDLAWWSDLRGDQRGDVSEAQRTVFAVGFAGSQVSRDRGKTWEQFDDGAFWTIDCARGSLACWAAGPEGRIARLVVSE